jgi:hypothetical protein
MSGPKVNDATSVTLNDYAKNPYAAMAKQAVQDTQALLAVIPEAATFNDKMCGLLEPITPTAIGQLCNRLRSLAPKR